MFLWFCAVCFWLTFTFRLIEGGFTNKGGRLRSKAAKRLYLQLAITLAIVGYALLALTGYWLYF